MNINFDVPLDEHGQNANLKGHILDKQTMNDHMFHLLGDNIWRFGKRVHPKAHISMHIEMINERISIDILDDDFLQPYDYARYGNAIIWNNIQDIMQGLTDVGIIIGYKRNDYI